LPAGHAGDSGKTAAPSPSAGPPAQQQPAAPGDKRIHRMKPAGVDTRVASALFGQLNDFLESATAKDQLSPEEIEEMKSKMKTTSS